MVNVRTLSPPEWCNTASERKNDAATCEEAYFISGGMYYPCVYDAANSKCVGGAEVSC